MAGKNVGKRGGDLMSKKKKFKFTIKEQAIKPLKQIKGFKLNILLEENEPPPEVEPPPELEPPPEPKEVRNIVLAGNSHMAGYARALKKHLKESNPDIEYKFFKISKPQGHGGELIGQLNLLDSLLAGDLREQNVHAIIHGGSSPERNWKSRLERLLTKYREVTPNISFIGSPSPRTDFADIQSRITQNKEIADYLNEQGASYYNVFDTRLETADYARGNHGQIHPNIKGYKKVYQPIRNRLLNQINPPPLTGQLTPIKAQKAQEHGFDLNNLSREQRTFLSYATFGPDALATLKLGRDIKAVMLLGDYDYDEATEFVDDHSGAFPDENIRDFYKEELLDILKTHPDREKLEKNLLGHRNYEELQVPEAREVEIRLFDLPRSITRYDRLFNEAARHESIDAMPLTSRMLKAIASAESSLSPNVISYAGAAGIMQLMPSVATGRNAGLTVDSNSVTCVHNCGNPPAAALTRDERAHYRRNRRYVKTPEFTGVDERFDPTKAIPAAARLLNWNYKQVLRELRRRGQGNISDKHKLMIAFLSYRDGQSGVFNNRNKWYHNYMENNDFEGLFNEILNTGRDNYLKRILIRSGVSRMTE